MLFKVKNTPADFVKDLNLFNGTITYNDFDIDENISFEERWYTYKEDILQIAYGSRYILDVGWYPGSNPKGKFVVQAITDYDWVNPVSKKKCRTLKGLKKAIEETAMLIHRIRQSSDHVINKKPNV